MAKHLENQTELQSLAERLGELYDEIKLIDEHESDIKNGDPFHDKCIDDGFQELWDQYRGITEYMPFVLPMDFKDCLILAVVANTFLENLTKSEFPDDSARERNEELLNRTMARLITGLENEIGVKAEDLGLHQYFLINIDQNRKAVQAVNEICQWQYENAKKAGIVDIVKADAKSDQEEPASGQAAKPARKPTASRRAKPKTEPVGG